MRLERKNSGIWQGARGMIERAKEQIRFLKYERDFGERDSDIYIVSFPRSGTTLLQVITYHLTRDGEMTYRRLDEVSPWLRNLAMKKLPVPDVADPRIIKTHDPYSLIHPGKKGKFIFILRNPADVVVSNYYNWKNYNDRDLKLEEVFDKLIRTNSATGYFNYNRKWLENKKGLPILYLRYEDVVNNKQREIEKIAVFLNVPILEVKLRELLELSSFDYMKEHEHKFGEPQPKSNPTGIYNQFIRQGQVGEGEMMLSKEQLAFCKEQFDKLLQGPRNLP